MIEPATCGLANVRGWPVMQSATLHGCASWSLCERSCDAVAWASPALIIAPCVERFVFLLGKKVSAITVTPWLSLVDLLPDRRFFRGPA